MGIIVGLEKKPCLSETVDEESLGGNALTTMMVACSVSRALVAQLVTPDFCFHCLHQTWWYGISRLPCPLRRQTQMRVCQLWIMQSRGSKFQSGKFFIRHRSAFVIVIVVRCQISMWGVQRRSKSGTESFAELMRHDGRKDWLRASNESRSSKTSLSVARRMRSHAYEFGGFLSVQSICLRSWMYVPQTGPQTEVIEIECNRTLDPVLPCSYPEIAIQVKKQLATAWGSKW